MNHIKTPWLIAMLFVSGLSCKGEVSNPGDEEFFEPDGFTLEDRQFVEESMEWPEDGGIGESDDGGIVQNEESSDAGSSEDLGPVPCGSNLMANGDFEDGESPTFAGLGAGWESNDAAAHPGYHVLDTTQKHAGSTSQKIDTLGEWDHFPIRQVSAYNSVTSGKSYRLSAWIKSQGNDNPAAWYVIGIWWFNNDTRLAQDSEVKNPRPDINNYDWRLFEFEAIAPAEANRVAVFLTAHYHGVVWYDDIVLCQQNP